MKNDDQWHRSHRADPFDVVIQTLAEYRERLSEELDRIDGSVADTRQTRGGAADDSER